MSAAVVSRQQPGSAGHSTGGTSNSNPRMGTHSPVDSKKSNSKSEDKQRPSSDQSNNNGRDTAKNSSKVASHTLSPLSNSSLPVASSIHPPQVAVDQPPDATKPSPQNNHGPGPSRSLPNKKLSGDTPGDYFTTTHTRLDQEPNPFEQSFASTSDPLSTPKTILPPVTAITSPASLLPGGSGGSAFNWGLNSLRSGPLSPAMLQGPASGSNVGSSSSLAFDTHIRTGLTPNESGIRSGLTPGGSGSLFAPSSAGSVLFQQFGGGGATPGTMEFQRTALLAARKSSHPAPSLMSPQQQHQLDNYHAADPAHNAANGLFLLANAQHQQQEAAGASGAGMNTGSALSYPGGPASSGATAIDGSRISEISDGFGGSSDEEMQNTGSRRNTRPKNPKGKQSAASSGRRKADDSPGGTGRSQAKKVKGPQGQSMSVSGGSDDGQDDGKDENGKDTKKMTDEEKRKNFLERNRVAALKCRQRKKQWLASLQAKVEIFSSENDALTAQVTSLREEIVSLKTLLLAHKDCPVARSNGGNMATLDMNTGMNNDYGHVPMMTSHYGGMTGMGGGVMAPPGAGRRYS
ncbi:unnamed protein product [Tuber melanosporum]|uniref:(Perigord truffle) hypothetical protein n=1 Tax=Tuber melanosporum (strain Mel28) TaxID=656061 RepID=D5G8I5_TUBMM|nr:uncharacterized protein GSTUM_00002889001 [Tuber melanosporum]CAZ80832.1 unnamed protein product [Tuber melanosporum]